MEPSALLAVVEDRAGNRHRKHRSGEAVELTPTTATMLAEITREVGLPPGVLNLVHGLGAKAGGALVAHPGVRTISFTAAR